MDAGSRDVIETLEGAVRVAGLRRCVDRLSLLPAMRR